MVSIIALHTDALSSSDGGLAAQLSRLVAMIRGVVWDRINLIELIRSYGTAGGSYRTRASCECSYLQGYSP